jgi:hypothetical protein
MLDAPADASVQLTLTAPPSAPFAWAASEWSLDVRNQSSHRLPFGALILGSSCDGVQVWFEVGAEGQSPVRLRSNSYLGNTCGAVDKVLEPHAVGQVTATLHGSMKSMPVARSGGRGGPGRFFRPVFEQPGTYFVTAVLLWGKTEFRSNSVTVQVKAPPEAWMPALEGLQDLAAAGLCVDVQGLGAENETKDLEQIAEYTARADGTVYGVQLSLGLASAYADILHYPEGAELLLREGGNASLERVRELRGPRPPVEFGMDRTWSALGDKVEELAREIAKRGR